MLHWSSLAWRGLASVVFGVVAFAWPGITLTALTLLFGAYALADGVLALVVALRREHRDHRWILLLDGVLGIGAGVVIFMWPGLSLLALVYLIAARAIIMGVLEIGAAIGFHDDALTRVLYALGGMASILFGAITFAFPGITAVVLLTFLAAYAIVFGVLLLVLGFKIRSMTRTGASEPQTAE
jgi:uncharacterized membrane protein HdeD (DUF308 family)